MEKMLRALRLSVLSIYIIPLVLICYLYVEYIYPLFVHTGQEESALGVTAMLTFTVIVSLLGLFVINKSVRSGGSALENINERMGMLLASTKQFEEAGYVDTLVESVTSSAKDILDAEASALLLYDSEGALRYKHVEGPAAGTLKGKALRPGDGIAGWAVKEGRPLVINELRNDPRFFGRLDECYGLSASCVACAPLAFSGSDLGLIEVINKRGGGQFSEQDQRALAALAEHASAAIYRNRALEENKGDFVHVLDILMTALDNLMPDKKGHSTRVAHYSVKLAKAMGLPDDDVRKVYFGALLHDVGLMKYDLSEYEDKSKYRLHPSVGAEMVKDIAQWKDVAPIIREHHERYDGTGYPAGLSGPDIALGARIVGLAEAFDVMTSPKSYKPTIMSFGEAVEEIKRYYGRQFDPRVVDAFIDSFREEDIQDA